MPRKTFSPGQMVARLRLIDVALGSGKCTQLPCKEAGISGQSYNLWRRQCGGLQQDQAKRFKELERENARLKKLLAELSLQNAMLEEIALGNC